MTPREKIISFPVETSLNLLYDAAREHHFDIIPLSLNGTIDYFYYIQNNSIYPMTKEWLLSHDTPILVLILLFVQSQKPAYFVFHKQEIVGIVTPAELNKIQAKVFFYHLIGNLEMVLVDYFRRSYGIDENEILKLLKKKRLEEIQKRYFELKSGNAEVDLIRVLNFSDLCKMIIHDETLRKKFSFNSQKETKKILCDIVLFRNDVMHPVRYLIQKVPEDISKLEKRIQKIIDVQQRT